MDVYDRERFLQSQLNSFLQESLALPASDYYSRLDGTALAELKSLLSNIHNILTLKVCLSFADWLGEMLQFDTATRKRIKDSIFTNPPNANGYDIEITDPIGVIAEVKCNVPINRGSEYGS